MTDINRAVAEKVMGWDYDHLGGVLDDRQHPAWIAQDSSWIRVEDWNPSKRIDHAWMVVEKFRKVDIHRRFDEYNCIIDEKYESRWQDAAPMAISLAALEAVKEGRDE